MGMIFELWIKIEEEMSRRVYRIEGGDGNDGVWMSWKDGGSLGAKRDINYDVFVDGARTYCGGNLNYAMNAWRA